MRRLIFLFLLPLFVVAQLFGDSSVWKISKGRETMYIGGTIHILRSSDFPLPDEFDRAYALSDTVVFETDLEGTQNETFAATLAQKMFFPAGKTLSNTLKSQTYAALKKYLASQGDDIKKYERLRPWAVMLVMTQTVLGRSGIDQSGVDAHYSRRASTENKPQRYLETPTEQMALITRIGEGEEDAMILQSIREMRMMPEMIDWLVRDWREGKTKRMESELVQAMKHESPQMYRLILKERNDAWMPKLIGMMREGKKGFVLVGTMHLLGQDGMLKQFEKAGYTVSVFKE
ncbi:MAG: hypothetical protein JU82_04935 [Sulfuricurvum sp. MLSB]|uniref:TraB/GumN family protein n=1 Tax=unclassified Sulfuricurvum TaxID=2632390 RepID=UPI0005009A34|nr:MULTISPECIES: TraB/GumN family protein [unclassified Sulfuricurvum]KFN40075.1 MAG: hypothetical protein JU82_04935 [Sulfuricurvum sp. MLSB]